MAFISVQSSIFISTWKLYLIEFEKFQCGIGNTARNIVQTNQPVSLSFKVFATSTASVATAFSFFKKNQRQPIAVSLSNYDKISNESYEQSI